MNEYQLPEEPAGPVWDQHGSRWVRIPETYPVLWKVEGSMELPPGPHEDATVT